MTNGLHFHLWASNYVTYLPLVSISLFFSRKTGSLPLPNLKNTVYLIYNIQLLEAKEIRSNLPPQLPIVMNSSPNICQVNIPM